MCQGSKAGRLKRDQPDKRQDHRQRREIAQGSAHVVREYFHARTVPERAAKYKGKR